MLRFEHFAHLGVNVWTPLVRGSRSERFSCCPASVLLTPKRPQGFRCGDVEQAPDVTYARSHDLNYSESPLGFAEVDVLIRQEVSMRVRLKFGAAHMQFMVQGVAQRRGCIVVPSKAV
jgi:hypothetical protein